MISDLKIQILISIACTISIIVLLEARHIVLKKINKKKDIRKEKIDCLLKVASSMINNKNIEDAANIVNGVLATDPKHFSALCLQAAIFDYKDKHNESIQIINKLSERSKHDGGKTSLFAHPLAVRGYISESAILYGKVIIKKKEKKIREKEYIYLPSWWIDRIGHFCFLDSYIKMEKLGWNKPKKKILLAPKSAISNSYLLSLYKKFFSEIVTDESLCQKLMLEVEVPEAIFFGAFVDNNNRSSWWISKAWEAQHTWDKNGYEPLIQMSNQDKLFCQKKLKKIGISKKDWFVCMHVRNSNFHKNKPDPSQDFRDSNFTYLKKSVQEIIKRGGWVFRLGDANQNSVEFSNKRFVNYAFSSLKCEILDIYLSSECRFFLGSNSGLSSVPGLFNTPAMAINFLPIGTEMFLKKGIFIPKLLYSKNKKRLLNFHEMMKEPIGQTHDGLILDKLLVKNNSPDEIKKSVIEMFKRLSNKNTLKDFNILQKKFQKIRRQNNINCNIPIGSDFLIKYKKLLLKEN